MEFKNFVFFDNEFICSKQGYYPVQVSFIGTYYKNKKFYESIKYNGYIKQRNPKILNKYFVRYTGITNDFLKLNGSKRKTIKKELIEYINSFDLNDTLFVGWSIYNDLEVLNQLTKSLRFNIKKVQFLDLSEVYMNINSNKDHSKLSVACDKYDLESTEWHNAKADAFMTYRLFEKIVEQIGLDKIVKGNTYNYKK